MRDGPLETFLSTLATAVEARAPKGAPVASLQRLIFDRASQPADTPAAALVSPPPEAEAGDVAQFVSRHLDDALDGISGREDDLGAVGRSFRALAGDLVWAQRPAGSDDPPGFRDAHANATIVGVDGLEVRDDIRIGASLVAPGIAYPAHRHPPEELYLVLSDGEWRNTDHDWWAPGVGGLVHNPPGIEHAMRAGDGPLFAIWCLLIDAAETPSATR